MQPSTNPRGLMQATLRSIMVAVTGLLAVGLVACEPEKDEITGPIGVDGGGASQPTFANVSSALVAACGSCHGASSGRTFVASMDSARLVMSGLTNPASPGSSAILVKPRSTSHGGGVVLALSTRDSALIATWIGAQPNVGASTLTAVRTDFAPTVDGLGEALWTQAAPLTASIGGGWAAAREVAVRALYDENYLYLYLRWHDREASYRRQPWVKQADGTWTVAAAKPRPTDGTDWAAYMAARGGANFNSEAPEYMYEDKVAIAWNTYGPTTVPGFEQAGCAAACHDPTKGGSPGTTYNLTRQDLGAKKYLTVPGQILDLWHWKMVRHNMNSKMDDQYVRYWVPVNDATAADGGRASDAGAAGYRSNPALNGRPMYRSASKGLLPPIYSWAEGDTVRMTDADVAAFPVGTAVANMITSMPTGTRADVDARGVYDAVARVWTMEIRRRLVTGDDKDVQFNDLARTYKFGIAIFDNAQIEHSYSGVPQNLVFKR
jgi:hypothetical protein